MTNISLFAHLPQLHYTTQLRTKIGILYCMFGNVCLLISGPETTDMYSTLYRVSVNHRHTVLYRVSVNHRHVLYRVSVNRCIFSHCGWFILLCGDSDYFCDRVGWNNLSLHLVKYRKFVAKSLS